MKISNSTSSYITKTRIGVLAVSAMGMASLAITPSYAAIARTFALSNTGVQMLTSLPNLFMMIAGIVVGKLTAAKLNLKILTLAAIVLIVLGGFMPLVYNSSFAFLMGCSCLVGLGQGACTNLSQVLISQLLPKKLQQSTMGLTTTFTNIGGIIFIMGGGQLAASSSWINNYWIYIFSLLVLVVAILLIPLSPRDLNEDLSNTKSNHGIKLNKYVFYCAFWAFLIMMLNNVLNNNISLFIVQEKLGGTSEAALTSTLSLVGGMLCGFIVGIIGKKFKYTSISIAYLLYGLSYLLIAYSNSLLIVIIGSFIVGAAMSIAMGTFPYLISISVNKNSISMALGVYTAINAVGGVISPFVINPITTTLSKVGFNAFSVGSVIALIIYVAILFSGFQKKLVINAENN